MVIIPTWAPHQTIAKVERSSGGSTKANEKWSGKSLVLAYDHRELGLSSQMLITLLGPFDVKITTIESEWKGPRSQPLGTRA